MGTSKAGHYKASNLSDTEQQHVPAHFDHVTKHLEAEGYTCVGVDLPGNTTEPHIDGRLIEIQDDIAAVRKTVLSELDSGNDVLVVTHSYSSIPGTAALAHLSKTSRLAEGKTTGVVAVVIISGFLLPPDTNMLAIMGGHLPPQYLHEGDVTLPFNGPGAVQILYHDLEHNEALKAVWKLKPQSYGINTSSTPDQVAGLRGIPLSYLLCSNDNAVPWEAQRQTVEGFRAAGIDVHAEVAASGHSPFLKLPLETSRFIRKAAGERVETGFEMFDGGSRLGTRS